MGQNNKKVEAFGSSGHAIIGEHETKLVLGCDLDLSTKQLPTTSSRINVKGNFVIELQLKSLLIVHEVMNVFEELKTKLIGI
jgi:ABC-type tungstate transport system substrate-binding protein